MLRRQHAVEGKEGDAVGSLFKQGDALPDLGLSGEEGEDVALLLAQGYAHCPGSRRSGVAGLYVVEMYDFYGMDAPGGFDQRRLQTAADICGVYGGRHDHHAQVGAHELLGTEGEREGHVGGEAPLVIFVEDYGRAAVERGVGDEHPFEDSLGDHFDAGGG